jgi:hypothetical protein
MLPSRPLWGRDDALVLRLLAKQPRERVGYAADLGSWDDSLANAFTDVDLLALEFNHDVHMEKHSGRADALIERVLGDHGHLSNDQAADLVAEVVDRCRHSADQLDRYCGSGVVPPPARQRAVRDNGERLRGVMF